MTGQILDYSIQTNTGFISGDDGNRYTFTGADWQEGSPPRAGTRVDFAPEGNTATAIYNEIPANNAAPAGNPAMAAPAPAYSQPGYDQPGYAQTVMGTDLEVASVMQRIAAFLLDQIALPILTLGIGYLIWLVIVMAQGQTPGKQLMGLRVVRADDSTASWGLMFGRGCCKFITEWFPLVIVSFVMMLTDSDHRAIHDRMVSTRVVRNR